MGARDAELAVEDEGRHRRNPEPAHLFFQCGDFLRISLQRPARNPAALRNLLQHFGIADVLGLFEVGAEKLVDHRLAGALALGELDQAVRSEDARRARHALERGLDALAAALRGAATYGAFRAPDLTCCTGTAIGSPRSGGCRSVPALAASASCAPGWSSRRHVPSLFRPIFPASSTASRLRSRAVSIPTARVP